MRTLLPTTQFKKDLKRIKHSSKKIQDLKNAPKILAETGTFPPEYSPHRLEGDYRDCMECHIESDTLLIWFDETESIIRLIRYGTHSELFK